ncbi:hypothetical protein D3C80_1534330 [compost metagenome]
MARINAVGLHLVGVHVDQGAKVLVRGRAVVALKEIVDHVLPVRLDVVGQPVSEGQLLDVRCPVHDFLGQVTRLFT